MANLSSKGKLVLVMALGVILGGAIVLLMVEDSTLQEEALTGAAGVDPTATSELLLPYFEVDLHGGGFTTHFAVVNASSEPVDVEARVFSNWGIEILKSSFRMRPNQTRSVNLSDWLVDGKLLGGRQLEAGELEQCQAALTGQLAPDNLYYSTEVEIGRLVGYVTLTTKRNVDAIFGDYFVVDPTQDFSEGEVLIDLARSDECDLLCRRHGLRFLTRGLYEGTEVVIWTGGTAQPASSPFFEGSEVPAAIDAYRMNGDLVGQEQRGFMPLHILKVSELNLTANAGWLDFFTDQASFMTVRYSAQRHSVVLQTACLPTIPPPGGEDTPRIVIEKATNGADADRPPGPRLQPGSEVKWTYSVTNTGNLDLFDVAVDDDREGFICDIGELKVGESSICEAFGVAQQGQYANLGSVTGTTQDGQGVSASDPSHYNGNPSSENPAIDIEKATNGIDADQAPGPQLQADEAVIWTYVVTNTGDVDLSNVTVDDDKEGHICQIDSLPTGDSFDCQAQQDSGQSGQYANLGTVRATSPAGDEVSDSDPSHCFILPEEVEAPSIDIEKATNGADADAAPGVEIQAGDAVTWTYVVTNNGGVDLSNVTVNDDREGQICQVGDLEVGASTTCTAAGIATLGQYSNVGTVTGTSPQGQTVDDSDPSNYVGKPEPENPAIDIEKATNGADADAAPGVEIQQGGAVTWTYVVTNTGDVDLSNVTVNDDREGQICQVGDLEVGASTTCTAAGIATLGQYSNRGTATGTSPQGQTVNDSDPSNYYGTPEPENPAIDIEKATNGADADAAPGVEIQQGGAVTWTYVVTNTGDVDLSNVTVNDDKEGQICQPGNLSVGASTTCTAQGIATLGQYGNRGTVTGTSPQGTTVNDSDPSHYIGQPPPEASLTLVKRVVNDDGGSLGVNDFPLFINGQQVTSGIAVQLAPGSYTASEQNQTGYVAGTWTGACAANGTVSLAAGESKTCTITNDDAPRDLDQGCTPGYWKNHTDSWTGYSPSQSAASVFSSAASYADGSATLLQALNAGGGGGVDGAVRNLLRAATASLLNTSHPGVAYPRTTASVIADTNAALASNDRATMLNLAGAIDRDNNLGCPLN